MSAQATHSRNFLLSVIGSLILHLVVLLIILVPGNNRAPVAQDNPQFEKKQEFSPTLIIRASVEQLEKAQLMLDYRGKIIPKDRSSWSKNNFEDTFRTTLQKQNITVTTASLQRGELNRSVFSVRADLTSSSEKVLEDNLFAIYVTGLATLSSNFSSDNLVIVSSSEEGQIINLKIPTYDCRLYANKKLSGEQLIQKIMLF